MANETVNQDTQNTTTEQNKSEQTVDQDKKFSQKEVNDIVEGRLARQKSEFKDFETFKKSHEEFLKIKPEFDKLTTQNSENEKILEDVLNDFVNNIDESKRTLIPDLSVKEKIQYITKNKKILINDTVPIIPMITKKDEADPGLIVGKYKNLNEFANANPVEFLKYMEQQKTKI